MSGTVDEIIINNQYTKYITSNYENEPMNTEPKIIKSFIETPKFLNKFMKKFNRDSEILPSNCKYSKVLSGGYKMFVIEDEPKVRTITFRSDFSSMLERHKQNGKYEEYGLDKIKLEEYQKFTISLPYVIYIITLTNSNAYAGMKVFFRLNPLTTFNDYLLSPCLTNINEDYNVCLGFSNKYQSVGNSSLVIRQLIDEFWFNRFNYDYAAHFEEYEDVPEICDLFTWQYNTKTDPLFIFTTKWKRAKRYNNIGDVLNNNIKRYRDLDPLSVFSSFLSDILKDESADGTYESRNLECDSVMLSDDSLVSIGDELIIDNKKYYITTFIHNSYGEITGIKLEDEKDKTAIITIDVSKVNGVRKITKAIKDSKIKEFKINDTNFKEGDLVFFEISKDVRIVEKILQTRDGMFQIKVGKDFYLPSAFLKQNLRKMDENFKFFDIDLIPNKDYGLIDGDNSDSLFKRYEEATFVKLFPKNSKICFTFKKKSNGNPLELNYNDKCFFTPIETSSALAPYIYRLHDEIFINEPTFKNPTYLIKGRGIGIGGYNDYVSTSDRKQICRYNPTLAREFFNGICNSKETKFTIPSFDRDVTFEVGEEVITIDWNKPDEMFNIWTITGFSMNNTSFLLNLLNGKTAIQYPVVTLSTGKNNFACVRKVARNINKYSVGMRLRAIKSGIVDFPGKDCNEIRAFIIDEEREPLVLFSNYRTLWFSTLNKQNFKVIDPKTKVGAKIKVSPPSLKIKIQDGDVFNSSGTKISCVYSKYYKRSYFYNLSCSSYDGLRTIGFAKIENLNRRYGLLLPRSTENQLNAGIYELGYTTLYGGVLQTNKNSNKIGIRRSFELIDEAPDMEIDANGEYIQIPEPVAVAAVEI